MSVASLGGKAEPSDFLAKLDDDWTGLANRVERRKVQNRLYQRAGRRRLKATSFAQNDVGRDRFTQGCNIYPNTHNLAPAQQWYASRRLPWPHSPSHYHDSSTSSNCPLIIIPMEVQQNRNDGIQPNFYFPLTPDHLITLIQYNVYRGFISNILLLNIGDLTNETCTFLTSPHPTSLIPISLHPTHLQQSTPHPCWIDILPDHKLRDNLIQAQGFYDEWSLFNDLVGEVCSRLSTCFTSNAQSTSRAENSEKQQERRGLIVWSDPWDVSGWEVTPGFLVKWGWMARGCDELIAGSNRWRAQRGDEPLLLELKLQT